MANRANKNTFSNQGFTLVELAIVLVIVGLLVGLGTSMVGPLMTATKVRETRDNLDANSQAIASWASANNRLPQLSSFTTNSPVAKTQMDAWTRPFVFLYYSSLAPSSATSATKDTICGRRSTPLAVTTSDLTTVSNVAYIILSGGDNGASTIKSNFAIGSTFLGGSAYGVATPIPRLSSSSTAVGGNATGTITVDPTSSDLVRWVTLDELRSKVGCQGAPLKIVNNELPYGYNNITYNAVVYADGGVPFSTVPGKYAWCIQNSLVTATSPAGMTFKNGAGTAIPFNASCSTLAKSSWVQSDNLVIAGAPVISVTGSDSKVYTSLKAHVADATNQPITGASYTTYWATAASGATGSTWQPSATTTTYYPSPSNTITVYVRDDNDHTNGVNDNISYKSFVFTVNPK